VNSATKEKSLCHLAFGLVTAAVVLALATWSTAAEASIPRELPQWVIGSAPKPSPPELPAWVNPPAAETEAPAGSTSWRRSLRLFQVVTWSGAGWELPPPRAFGGLYGKTRVRGFKLGSRGGVGANGWQIPISIRDIEARYDERASGDQNRYYDPEMGRFISADPMGFVDGPSMYAFAGYDPVNMGDPLGLEIMVTGTYQDKYLEYLQRLLPFQIKLDKGKVVLDGVAGKKKLKKLRKSLDKKELELFKAIVQRIKITIATTGRDSGINFGRFDGKGKNSLDFSDLKLLEESNNAGGPFTPERVVGHETLEAFASAKDHKRPPSPKNTAAHEVYMRELLYRSHIDANQYFGGLGDVIPKSEKKTYTEDKSKIVTISLEIPIHGSSGHSIRVTHKFITPTPVVPEGDEKSPAHIVDVERIPR